MKAKEIQAVKKLLIAVVLFVVIIVVWDFLFGRAIIAYIKYKNLNTSSGLEYAVYKKADILIFGASQAEVGFNSKLIAKETKLKTVSLAQSASNSAYCYILLKEYLKHYKPKYVIYATALSDLVDEGKVLSNSRRFGYLYGQDKDIDSILAKAYPHVKLTLFFNMIKYNSLMLDILKNQNVANGHDKYRPYKPDNGKNIIYLLNQLKKNNPKDWMQITADTQKIETNSISYKSFNKLLKLCNDNQINLLLIYTPVYKSADYPVDLAPVPQYFLHLPKSPYISFYDISTAAYPYFTNKKYYKDRVHLNSWGADSLSSIVSRIIVNKKVIATN